MEPASASDQRSLNYRHVGKSFKHNSRMINKQFWNLFQAKPKPIEQKKFGKKIYFSFYTSSPQIENYVRSINDNLTM